MFLKYLSYKNGKKKANFFLIEFKTLHPKSVENNIASSTVQEDSNEELFVMDKSETKAMEELFDKLVAEDSNLNQKPVVRSRSFDAIEKWLQNSSDPQTQKGKYHFF